MTRTRIRVPAALGLVVGLAAACGGGTPTTTGQRTSVPPSTSRAGTTTTTAPREPLTAQASVNPDQGPAGIPLTFTVVIRGPGTLSGEGVEFGDGTTSGANAGNVACGSTARADHTSSYTHTYAHPGTFRFRDQVTVVSPAPSCTSERVTATLTVVVAAPLATASLNGAFLSPTHNLACYIDSTPPGSVRCASFSPPILVTMDPTGTYQVCNGTQCELGNPSSETPDLPYGSAIADGTFQCLSTTAGLTCTVVGHHGFLLSRSGVQRVG